MYRRQITDRIKESLKDTRVLLINGARSAQMYHFRDQRGAEVDIVLETPSGELVGLEVKATTSPNDDDLAGLRALQALTGERFRRGVLLHTGKTALHFGPHLYVMPIASLWRAS